MSRKCLKCGAVVDAFNGKMVMLHDSLWNNVCNNFEDVLCDKCIELKLKRRISKKDLKENIFVNNEYIKLKNL